MLKLDRTLPNPANICLHNCTVAKFYAITDEDQNPMEKIREDVVGGSSTILTRKALVDETFIGKSTKEVNQLWGLMLAIYTSARCVNLHPPVLTRAEISIYRQENSHLAETRSVALKMWSSPIFNEEDQIAKLRASIQQVDRRKLTALVLMVFFLNAILCSKQWAAFTFFVKRLVRLSLKTIFNVVVKK